MENSYSCNIVIHNCFSCDICAWIVFVYPLLKDLPSHKWILWHGSYLFIRFSEILRESLKFCNAVIIKYYKPDTQRVIIFSLNR